ncbi:MAG: RelA/SpoT domain-containing protein [Oscillospiraceae bacterium]|nr:RelA/SpoT domain-containing protein [Oscillospiraceae bacterium]
MSIERRCNGVDWKKPEYDKSTVKKAGKAVAKNDFSKIDEAQAYKVINNWRSSHAYPLKAFYLLGKCYAEKNKGILVVQRLKRLESILAKLIRFPAMGLETMQDLGGCRVIVNDISEVKNAVREYNNSNIKSNLVKIYDYITNPKEDGYRSVHLVYEYIGPNTEYIGLKTEVQIRTTLQHCWATAVEALSLRKSVNLKAGEGDEKTLRYMALISALFSIEENAPLSKYVPQNPIEIFNEAKVLDVETNSLNIIRAIRMLPTFSGERERERSYYLIRVDAKTGESKVYGYDETQFEAAADFCAEIEKTNHGAFAVLVSASDANALLKAYPNYLADANLFVERVDTLMEKYESL